MAIFPLQLAQGSTPQGVVDSLFARIETLVSRDPVSGDFRKGVVDVQSLTPQKVDQWTYTGAIYQLNVAPSWLERTAPNIDSDDNDEDGDSDEIDRADDPKAGFRQRIWHLALVGAAAIPGQNQAAGRLIIHATQDTVARRLREYVTAGRFGSVLSGGPPSVPMTVRHQPTRSLGSRA